jgi:hypothetical protein
VTKAPLCEPDLSIEDLIKRLLDSPVQISKAFTGHSCDKIYL